MMKKQDLVSDKHWLPSVTDAKQRWAAAKIWVRRRPRTAAEKKSAYQEIDIALQVYREDESRQRLSRQDLIAVAERVNQFETAVFRN